MAQTGQRIYRTCTTCDGTGKQYTNPHGSRSTNPENDPTHGPWSEVPCVQCKGAQQEMWGWLRDEKEITMPGEEA